MAVSARDRADACPGVLTTHPADDGPLVRLRVPGGALTRYQLQALAGCAEHTSDGRLHLTSRANVQLRGAADPAALALTLADAGLLPSPTHERVRNILVSPLSGIAGGVVDGRPLRDELDHTLCADPTLAALPGRFQFGIDDGRGDLPLPALDVGWQALDDDGAETTFGTQHATPGQPGTTSGLLVVAGHDSGLRVPLDAAVPAMVEAARAFLALRDDAASTAWHARELDPEGSTITAAVRRALPDSGDSGAPVGSAGYTPPPVGILTHDDSDARAVHAAVPLGAVSVDQLELVAELAAHGVVVTPWRTVLLPGLTPAAAALAAAMLDSAGLVLDPADPSPGVTACIGRPGCASSRADVRRDAARVTAAVPPGARVHLSGCERRCGSPRGGYVDAVATDDGYAVDGSAVAAGELASEIATIASSAATAATAAAEPAAPGEPFTSTPRTPTGPHHTRGAAE